MWRIIKMYYGETTTAAKKNIFIHTWNEAGVLLSWHEFVFFFFVQNDVFRNIRVSFDKKIMLLLRKMMSRGYTGVGRLSTTTPTGAHARNQYDYDEQQNGGSNEIGNFWINYLWDNAGGFLDRNCCYHLMPESSIVDNSDKYDNVVVPHRTQLPEPNHNDSTLIALNILIQCLSYCLLFVHVNPRKEPKRKSRTDTFWIAGSQDLLNFSMK